MTCSCILAFSIMAAKTAGLTFYNRMVNKGKLCKVIKMHRVFTGEDFVTQKYYGVVEVELSED